MNLRLTAFAIALAAAGAAYGIYAGGASQEASAASTGAKWRDPPMPVDYSQSAPQFLHSLQRSGVFMIAPSAEQVAEAPKDPSLTFPRILSVAIIDGEKTAILRDAGGTRGRYSAGAELPNGWKLLSVNLEEIVAEREGKQYVFNVYKRAVN